MVYSIEFEINTVI